MPITKAPPTIEAPHLWNGQAYLNDLDNQNGHVKIDDIGVESETPDTIEPNQGRRGSYAYPTSLKSVTWTYTGRLRAKTLADLRTLEGGIRSAFRDRQALGTMVLLGEEASWFYTARIMDLEIPKAMKGGPHFVWPYQMDFQLTLRILDPRIYLLLPAGSGPNAGTATLVNDGTIDTDPTFTIPDHPGGDLTGTNATLGGVYLKFRDLPAGDVVIQFSKRLLTVDGVDRTALMDPDSTWWDENEQGLIAGAQSVTFGPGVTWSAVWFSATDAG